MAEEEGVSRRRDCPLVRGQIPSETAADAVPTHLQGCLAGDPEGAGEGDSGGGSLGG